MNQLWLNPRQLFHDVMACVTQAVAREGIDPPDRITARADGGETATGSVPGVTRRENTIGIA